MAEPTSKSELLELIIDHHRQMERYLFYFIKDSQGKFIAGDRPKFNKEEMVQPGVAGQYSLKDVLTQLSDWEGRLVRGYEAGVRGKVPEALDLTSWDDRKMEAIPAEYLQRTLEAVLKEFPASYRQALATVQSIPEEDLFTPGRYAWTGKATLADAITVCTYAHYDWAKQHIRRWRSRHTGKYLNKDIILERIVAERRQLEKNLEGLTPQEMVEEGVIGGWSVKDILAHLADWEGRFLGWYEAGLRGEVPQTPAPGLSWSQMDTLNQQIYEKHRDRSLEDVQVEFQRSYQRLLRTVEEIPEEDLFTPGRYAWMGKGTLAGYILANTANHYRWAKTGIRKWRKMTLT
jgi:hypothetical protein